MRDNTADQTLPLALSFPPPRPPARLPLAQELAAFCAFGQATRQATTCGLDNTGADFRIPTYINEFWTARQRQANSLHEVSYRACFKPQLPRFFIERLTVPGEVVYDPFMGRGTTLIESALLGRVPWGNDANPLSLVLSRPRLRPPTLVDIQARLDAIPLDDPADMPDDLLAFYHPETLRAISSLKKYLVVKQKKGALDPIDDWIALVALNRLTGHSAGFFSVYTLPPNQAVSVKSQLKINERRRQAPPRRDVKTLILKKSHQLLKDVDRATRETLSRVADAARLFTGPAQWTPQVPDDSVALVVTSPPFLNVVQYATDNWLRCWFLDIDPRSVELTVPKRVEDWQATMTEVFHELRRVLRPGGHIAFEVGEVHGGLTRLEEAVVPCGLAARLDPLLVLINDQAFTKTANCWGVDNRAKGTNSNRVVLFSKPS